MKACPGALGGDKRRPALALGLAFGFAALAFAAKAADLPTSAPSIPPPEAPSVTAPWFVQATLAGWFADPGGSVAIRKPPFQSMALGYASVMPRPVDDVMMTASLRDGTLIFGGDFSFTANTTSYAFKFRNSRFAPTIHVTQGFDAISSLYAGYRIPLPWPGFELYATLGGRIDHVSGAIGLTDPLLVFGGPQGLSVFWADPTAGLAAFYRIDPRWSFDARADIAVPGGYSKFSTQDIAEVSYNWTPAFATTLGLRYNYTDFSASRRNGEAFDYNASLFGPFVGLTVMF
jgi:hypothetical protein